MMLSVNLQTPDMMIFLNMTYSQKTSFLKNSQAFYQISNIIGPIIFFYEGTQRHSEAEVN